MIDQPVLILSSSTNYKRISLEEQSISSIVAKTLPLIVQEANVKFIGKHFNAARAKIVKNLEKSLSKLLESQNVEPRPEKYDSILGAFYRRGRWLYFAVVEGEPGMPDVLRFTKRGVGSMYRKVDLDNFEEQFEDVFSYCCEKMELPLELTSLSVIKYLLRSHLKNLLSQPQKRPA